VTSAGYFSKAVFPFIKKRSVAFLKFLNSNPEIIEKLLNQLEIKHLADIIEKIIINEGERTEECESYLQTRGELVEKLFEILKDDTKKDKHENVLNILAEII